jgi:alanine racemase
MRLTSYLEVRLDYLAQNLEKIKLLARGAQVIPMVKANAYGNGALPVSQFLVEELKQSTLGVAALGEALEIVRKHPSLETEILVFSDSEIHSEQGRDIYANHRITPVLHQPSDLEAVLKEKALKDLPLYLKLNTGMNRLGFTLDELVPFIPRLKSRGVKHLMTHFATSYYPLKDGDKTNRQMGEFKRIQKFLSDAGVSIEETSVSNSGAIEQGFGVEESHVRPGLMLYGPPSVEPQTWDGTQVSRFVTKILKTFLVKKGTPVGYGIHVTSEDCLMALIPLGYGDGLMTFASGVMLLVNGVPGKIFGRVNMDMAYIQFDVSASEKIKAEDVVEIWNHDNRVITDLANQMKTHAYQLMCGISSRVPRIYKVN